MSSEQPRKVVHSREQLVEILNDPDVKYAITKAVRIYVALGVACGTVFGIFVGLLIGSVVWL